MEKKEFFDEQTEQSEIKTEIVRKYFWAWAKIISNQVKKMGKSKIGYIDLFAGPGRYEKDNSKSTPLLILEGAIRDSKIREMLVTTFNDSDYENTQKLKEEINSIPNIKLLKHKPKIWNMEVGDALAEMFENIETIPTLYFLDPWGYKGLSLRLVKAVIKSWGCDCMFFFNYNRINAALSNPVMAENMNKFFGRNRAENLRKSIHGKSPKEREILIIGALKEALATFGGKFSIEYFFKDVKGEKMSHFLIFVSKNVLGYNIMKDIMARESSNINDGIANFGYNPKDKIGQAGLFDNIYSPIDDLANELLKGFSGETLSAKEIYHSHSVGRNFIFRNYQDALRKLEEQEKIITTPSSVERRKIDGIVTFSENVIVTFP
ncbi:MAG: three-Cys-motif partner protein TcmP [Aridibacter sp.]